MGEPWTQEQLEIERRREKRRAENIGLAKALAVSVFLILLSGQWAIVGYQAGYKFGQPRVACHQSHRSAPAPRPNGQ